ncbi:uroporphyrinogen decarboxylase family protein [Verrucomicrobiota bacterium]
MTSRERVAQTLNHEPADRVSVDLGGMHCSGAHVSVVYALRQALGLDNPGTPVKVIDCYQMAGHIGLDLIQALNLDIALVPGRCSMFGHPLSDWKPWTTFEGTPVLVPGLFNTDPGENGDILQYPEGDKTVPPSGRMPKGGFYVDAIMRQHPVDDNKLDPKDNLEEFGPISNEDLGFLKKGVEDLFHNTDLAITIGMPGAAFGDIALVPAPWMKDPKGIRDIEEWYISTVTRRDYLQEVFAQQAGICIENVKTIYDAVGNKVQLVNMDGADFATQESLFCSPDTYSELYLPHAKKVNDYIHKHTEWKTIKHCCGACEPMIPRFIEAGYDVLNPVQCSAAGMDPEMLVEKYGDEIVFWGGGVDTQKTLPFGTPEEVSREVEERVRILSKKNGLIFNAIHVIQCKTPVENVLAMFRAVGNA